MSESKTFYIGRLNVGESFPTVLVAEIGVNHNGKLSLAKELLHAAKKAGADAAKIQIFNPEDLTLPNAELCRYQESSVSKQNFTVTNQRELLRSLALSPSDCWRLAQEAKRIDLPLFASVFDEGSLKTALELDFPVIKFGSGELTTLPLHREAARRGKPVILSCGMATEEEIRRSVSIYREKNLPFLLLHCVSSYPAPEEQLNLRSIPYLAKRFNCPVGFSDHTQGTWASVLAVACGAVLIEKHFTLSRNLPGPDHCSSLEPDQFASFVQSVRKAEKALGKEGKFISPCEHELRRKVRKSIVLRRSVKAGEKVRREDLVFLRPAFGIDPLEVDKVVGMKAREDLQAGHILTWDNLC